MLGEKPVKRLGGRWAQANQVVQVPAKREEQSMDEGWTEISAEELREFLEADLLEVHADPRFKERLRKRLWDLVRTRHARRGDKAE
jgi:hypothetical protein